VKWIQQVLKPKFLIQPWAKIWMKSTKNYKLQEKTLSLLNKNWAKTIISKKSNSPHLEAIAKHQLLIRQHSWQKHWQRVVQLRKIQLNLWLVLTLMMWCWVNQVSRLFFI